MPIFLLPLYTVALRQYIIYLAVVEAIAALRIDVFAKELGLQKVQLESDAFQVLHTLRKETRIGVDMTN